MEKIVIKAVGEKQAMTELVEKQRLHQRKRSEEMEQSKMFRIGSKYKITIQSGIETRKNTGTVTKTTENEILLIDEDGEEYIINRHQYIYAKRIK